MSTRSTIDIGDDWHLYEEMLDETVWVEVRGVAFEAVLGGVSVKLPPAVIDAIRAANAAHFPHLRNANTTQPSTD